jgi:hypothetical protein
VPKGLLKPNELAFSEPKGFDIDYRPTKRKCSGCEGTTRHRDGPPGTCFLCAGTGRARAASPTPPPGTPHLWIPPGCGLVECWRIGDEETGSYVTRLVRQPEVRKPQPMNAQTLAHLVRHTSNQGDAGALRRAERAQAAATAQLERAQEVRERTHADLEAARTALADHVGETVEAGQRWRGPWLSYSYHYGGDHVEEQDIEVTIREVTRYEDGSPSVSIEREGFPRPYSYRTFFGVGEFLTLYRPSAPLHVADCPMTNSPPDEPCVCEGYGGPGGETRDTPEGAA